MSLSVSSVMIDAEVFSYYFLTAERIIKCKHELRLANLMVLFSALCDSRSELHERLCCWKVVFAYVASDGGRYFWGYIIQSARNKI